MSQLLMYLFSPQVTYRTPVPTGEVYFAETFDDGSLDRYSLTNNNQPPSTAEKCSINV